MNLPKTDITVPRKLIFSTFTESPPPPKKASRPRKKRDKLSLDDATSSRSSTGVVNAEPPRPSHGFEFISSDGDNDDARSRGHSAIVQSTELNADDATAQSEDEEGAVILDPKNSDRQYFSDPHTHLQREVWRPGDGNGDQSADYHDKPGPPAPLEKRWRFYQSRTGPGPIKHEVNIPPKYVILDDRAAYEVYSSDIPKATIVKGWPHDFSGNGKVRTRRPHRGRGSIGDPNAAGNNKYNFGEVGKDDRYFFTGQTDYNTIIYRSPGDNSLNHPQNGTKRRASSPPGEFDIRGRKIHRHNQFTPKDQLVKNGGAPHFGEAWKRYRPKINKFLTRDAGPEAAFDKERLYGQAPQHPIKGTFDTNLVIPDFLAEEDLAATIGDDRSMWIEAEQSRPAKKRKEALENVPVDPSELDEFRDIDDIENAVVGGVPTNEDSIVDNSSPGAAKPRRKRLPQHQNYLERLLAGQEDDNPATTTEEAPETTTYADSGSYASQLETKLAEARKTIERQKAEISGLKTGQEETQEKMRELEAEIAILRAGLGKAQGANDDSEDD